MHEVLYIVYYPDISSIVPLLHRSTPGKSRFVSSNISMHRDFTHLHLHSDCEVSLKLDKQPTLIYLSLFPPLSDSIFNHNTFTTCCNALRRQIPYAVASPAALLRAGQYHHLAAQSTEAEDISQTASTSDRLRVTDHDLATAKDNLVHERQW